MDNNVPAGLDEFISQSPAAPSAPAMQPEEPAQLGVSSSSPPPAGLDQFIAPEMSDLEHSSPLEMANTAAEAVGRGIAGPLFTGAETALGTPKEDILAREHANPTIASIGEIGGLTGSMMTGVGEGALLAKAGQAITKGFEGANALSKITAKAIGAGSEMGLFQGGSEISHMIVNDPNQSAQTALTNIGLATALGAGFGTVGGAAGELWKASKLPSKLGQLSEDFKGELSNQIANPNPAETVGNELAEHYKNIKSSADEVYGPEGLKAQDIEKAMPEMHEGITDQASSLYSDGKKMVDKMLEKPNSYPERLSSKLSDNLDQYQQAVSEAKTPGEIFNATQNLKSTLQDYAKFDKFVKPVDEAYDFVKDVKNLGHNVREALEDTDVWGNAAKRQQAINKGFQEFLPTLKDFEKKFTVEVAGEKQIDPAKVATYINQLGKPNAEIKQKMLSNFLNASEKYGKVINDTHVNLGIENPIKPSSLSVTKGTLNEVTPGAKLAKWFYNKGLSQAAGSAAGAGIGGAVGHVVGAGGIGALIGEHALGPLFGHTLDAIAKPMMQMIGNGEGLQAAVDYAAHVAKGESLVTKATKNIFKSGSMVLSENNMPSNKDIAKLDKVLQSYEKNPDKMLQMGGKVGHYLPENGTSIAQTSSNAVQYLNSQRPDANKNKAPLDSALPVSADAKAQFNRKLSIAQQPLVVMHNLKNGTITSQDVLTMRTLYPELYNGITTKLTNEMVDMMSKGKPIPYSLKKGLSVFMGQPMDSTLTPMGISSAQPMPTQNPNPQNPVSTKAPASSAMKGLDKLSDQYQTPLQHRALTRLQKD